MRRNAAYVLVTSMVLAAAAWAGCSSSAPSEPGRYVSTKDKYSIVYPEGWELKEGMMGTSSIALSPQEGETDTFRENINVVVERLPTAMSLDRYHDANVTELKRILGEDAEIDVADVELGDVNARRLDYSMTMGQLRTRALAFLAVSGKRGYVITCSALPDTLDRYRGTFEEAAETFRFE